jgi:prepilin-type processing-associated H-X9-DG protein/prepilin-type N-terminal cleavage/methylation domain-containing protein
MRHRHAQRAFTLIEVLVMVAIIAILIGILLPSLQRAREQTRAVQCLAALQQMGVAANNYCTTHAGRYPPYLFGSPDAVFSYGWDVIVEMCVIAGQRQSRVRPGLLWQGMSVKQINQCPSYQGGDNWVAHPYTGYNYNSSYVGYCDYQSELIGWPPAPTGRIIAAENPARAERVRQPADTALFGDGEYGSGANKFMRAPFKGRDAGFSGRSAGTQGYRHLDKTNVGFCDGHAQAWGQRFSETYAFDKANVQPHGRTHTGFLSRDNLLYDLD